MDILGNIPGIGKYVSMAEKVITILDRLTTDSGIKQQFKDTGRFAGTFTTGNYKVKFEILDTEKNTIDAELTEGGEK